MPRFPHDLAVRVCVPLAFVFLMTGLLMSQSWAQDQPALPDDLPKLIEVKNQLLQQFRVQNENNDEAAAIKTLTRLVQVHRNMLRLATSNDLEAELVTLLRENYRADTDYLLNVLYRRGEFAESGALGRELSEFHAADGAENRTVIGYRNHAVLMEQIAKLPVDNLLAYKNLIPGETHGNAALAEGKREEAAQLLSSAIQAQIALVGENQAAFAPRLSQLGLLLSELGKNAEARETLTQVLKIREATIGKNIDYAADLFNIASTYRAEGNFTLAEEYFIKAAEIEESLLGATHPNYLTTLKSLADIYRASAQKEKLTKIETKIGAASPLSVMLNHLPRSTIAAATMHPRTMMEDPRLQDLPFEVVRTMLNQRMGVDPNQIESCLVFATAPEVGWGLLIRLAPGAAVQFPWQDPASSEVLTHASGQQYYKSLHKEEMGAVEFSDGTYLLGSLNAMMQSLEESGESRTAQLLAKSQPFGQLVGAIDVAQFQFLWEAFMTGIPFPAELESLKSAPQDLDTLQLAIDFAQGFRFQMVASAKDSSAASRTADSLKLVVGFLQAAAMQEIDRNMDAPTGSIEHSAKLYGQRLAKTYLDKFQPQSNGETVVVDFHIADGSLASAFLVSAAILGAENSQPMNVAVSDQNNLRQIALAMHNYDSAFGNFPPRALYAPDGSPLLSWRVMILPFLEENELYQQFRLNEPWNSEHNLKLAQRMPDIYRSSQFDDPVKTVFLTFDGAGTFMEGNKGLKISQFTDGTSNTLMAVEANSEQSVIWTQPTDLPFDPQRPLAGLGGLRAQGLNVAFVDGSVVLLPAKLNPETVRKLVLRNDGEVIEMDW